MNSSIIKISAGALMLIIGLVLKNDPYISFLAFLIGYLSVGIDIMINAIKNILKGNIFNEHLLMASATIGAFFIGEYPEGVIVMIFYQIGELLNDSALEKSRHSIEQAVDIRPDHANLLVNGRPQPTLPQKIKIGDTIMIKPGERVPLDCLILDGNSSMDTSPLTGESIPSNVKSGDKILSGCINLSGTLIAEVKTSYEKSTVSRILDLVQNATEKKAHTEKFITKFAKSYTFVVMSVAVFISIIPPILIPQATFRDWVYRALVFLVASCPCALVISIPLSFFCGIGLASKMGILIKGSNFIEGLSTLNAVVFDKTGTLTKGSFSVTKTVPINIDKHKFMEIASHAEIHSSHPIAISIKRAFDRELDGTRVKNIQNLSGYGINAVIDDKNVYIGNDKLMNKIGVNPITTSSRGTVVHMAIEDKYAGYLIVSDKIKEDSIIGVKALYDMDIEKIAMLTGDSKKIAESVSNDLGLDFFAAELLPEDKVKEIKNIEKSLKNKGTLAFVGDGINDAPVMACADIGIAMGAIGTDAAIEASDVVIMDDKPSKVAKAISVSKLTMNTVKQNIVFSLGVKFAILILGILGLSTMWEAIFADVGVSLLVILNSLKILKKHNI